MLLKYMASVKSAVAQKWKGQLTSKESEILVEHICHSAEMEIYLH